MKGVRINKNAKGVYGELESTKRLQRKKITKYLRLNLVPT